jgi:deoxyribodipyrimidine photo-lyase
MEVLVKELAWRDYWQRIWQFFGSKINHDLRQPQRDAKHFGVPKAFLNASTGIEIIDSQILQLAATGYMHNHLRMYTASIACNIAHVHWHEPARWMYYHLLDGDWASNALSWQWVCGANSNKLYFANQDNINHYTRTTQIETFLDCAYEQFPLKEIPEQLKEIEKFEPTIFLPGKGELKIDKNKPIILYTHYNLDSEWLSDFDANRVLWFDEDLFTQYPVSDKVIKFILNWANKIDGIQIFVCNRTELINKLGGFNLHYKEHPLMQDIPGKVHARNWLVPELIGHFSSFFKYWQVIEPELQRQEGMWS